METAARYAGAIIIGYLLGAIPIGLLVGKLGKGMDVRDHGSRRTGATNVLRTLGWKAAAFVLLGDMAKGAGAVLIAGALAHSPSAGSGQALTAQAVAGVAAVAGHNWPVYVGFRGGRGVATGVGGLLVMSAWVGLAAFGLWLVVVAISRYVSLGSMLGPALAVVLSAILVALGRQSVAVLVYTFVATALILVQHRDNMVRLARGTERKLGQRRPDVS